jgi:hypothetical protein
LTGGAGALGNGASSAGGAHSRIIAVQPYLICRLKRDAALPEAPNHERAKVALEMLKKGETRSARQAGIAAGIVRAKGGAWQRRPQ